MKPMLAALSMLLAGIFLIIMMAIVGTFPAMDTSTNWAIFSLVDLVIVLLGLGAALEK